MPSRRQHPTSLTGLVHRRQIDRLGRDVGSSTWLQPDGWQDIEQHARVRFIQLVQLTIPARSVHEQAVDVSAVIGSLAVLLQPRDTAFIFIYATYAESTVQKTLCMHSLHCSLVQFAARNKNKTPEVRRAS